MSYVGSNVVNTVAGTTNQITASSSTGNVTLSTPNTFVAPGSATVTNLSTAGVVQNSAAGLLSTTATTQHAVQIGNASGQLSSLSVGATGTVLAGSTGADPSFTALSTLAVTSLSGTANQITASASTGSVTLSVPSSFIAPGSIEATTSVKADTNFLLPTTTSTVGQLQINAVPVLHSFGGVTDIYVGGNAGNLTTTGTHNSALGNIALAGVTSATDCTAIGYNSLNACSSGSNNTAVGSGALKAQTTSSQATAVGSGALAANTATANVGVGYNAGNAITSATQCVAVGASALASATTSGSSTAVGFSAGISTTGDSNSYFGSAAGSGVTTGNSNVAIGANAMSSGNAGAAGIVAIGVNSCLKVTGTGTATGVGHETLKALVGGTNCTAVGFQALTAATGNSNTALGYHAGNGIVGGSANVMIGDSSGTGITSGTGNVLIGSSAGSALVTGTESNNILINAAGSNNTSGTIFIGDGGIGTYTDCFISGIRGTTITGTQTVLINANGRLGSVSSTIRNKENVVDMGAKSEILYKMRPVSFTYKKEIIQDKGFPEVEPTEEYGLIAEEVEQLDPNLCTYEKDGRVHSVRYHMLHNMMLNEIQKLNKRIEALERRS